MPAARDNDAAPPQELCTFRASNYPLLLQAVINGASGKL